MLVTKSSTARNLLLEQNLIKNDGATCGKPWCIFISKSSICSMLITSTSFSAEREIIETSFLSKYFKIKLRAVTL